MPKTEIGAMAKKQRTIQLPEEIYRFADAIEKTSGARFNRQLLAALLQYFFSDPRGPDPLWMEYAVEIENDRIAVGDMPGVRAKEVIEEAKRAPGSTVSEGKLKDGTPIRHVSAAPFPKQAVAAWTRITDREGTDPVQKIIDHWSELGRRK